MPYLKFKKADPCKLELTYKNLGRDNYFLAKIEIKLTRRELTHLVDFTRSIDERFFDSGGGLGRCFHKDESVLARERLSFFSFHFSATVITVRKK